MKIFIFINTWAKEHYSAMAISEDGTILAVHLSSSEAWAKHDMGMFPDQCNWKHDQYKAHCPNGYELEYVPYIEAYNHEGLQAAFKKYKEKEEASVKPD